MTIALMRHGQTDWNLAGRVQGHTDIPLNDTGRAQALEAALAFADDHGLEAITSSPLARARETAEIIAHHLRIPLLDPLPILIEQNYGEAEGVSVKELSKRWPDRNFAGGESSAEVAGRGLQAIEHLADLDHRVLAVTHGAYIRRIISTVTGFEYYDVPGIINAQVTELAKTASGWHVLSVNGLTASEALQGYTPLQSTLTMVGGSADFCTTDGVCY